MTYTHVRAIESSTKSSAAIVVHEKEECKYSMFHLPLFTYILSLRYRMLQNKKNTEGEM